MKTKKIRKQMISFLFNKAKLLKKKLKEQFKKEIQKHYF